MKRERLWGTLRQVWLRARPFLVSALAVVLIALQQIYYLDDPATVVLNIILLGLNLLLFVPLVRNAGKAAAYSGDTVDRVLQWVGPVSYTHLDVYKRQERDVFMEEIFIVDESL